MTVYFQKNNKFFINFIILYIVLFSNTSFLRIETNNFAFNALFISIVFLLLTNASKNLKIINRIGNLFLVNPTNNNIVDSSFSLILNIIIFFLFSLFLEFSDSDNFVVKSIYLLFYTGFAVHIYRLLHKFLNIYILHSRENANKRVNLVLSLILIRSILNYYDVSLSSDLILYFTETMNVIITIMILFYSFSMGKVVNWIHLLERREKSIYFSFLILLVLVEFTLLASFGSKDNNLSNSIIEIYPHLESILVGSLVFVLPFSFRQLFAVISSFSSSEVVERKKSELDALTYINRLISSSSNLNEILDNINSLTINYTGANFSIIQTGNKISVINPKKYNSDRFINSKLINNFVNNLESPIIFNSIFTHKEFLFIRDIELDIKSFLLCPIKKNESQIGYIFISSEKEYNFENEDADLISAFSDNISIAIDKINLLEEIKEKQRLESEINLAFQMWEKLLPDKLPLINGYSIDAFAIPAQEVGGDYYDVLTLKNGNSCLIQGDVSGKGISAAFLMAELKGIISSLADESNSAKELLIKTNTKAYNSFEKNKFVTISCLEFNNLTKKISYIRAGHTPLAVFRGDKIEFLKPNGIGVGIINTSVFEENLEIIEVDSELIFCFTDGINELKSNSGKEYGFKGIERFIMENKEMTPIEINNKLQFELNNFSSNVFDDMTVFTIKKDLNGK